LNPQEKIINRLLLDQQANWSNQISWFRKRFGILAESEVTNMRASVEEKEFLLRQYFLAVVKLPE